MILNIRDILFLCVCLLLPYEFPHGDNKVVSYLAHASFYRSWTITQTAWNCRQFQLYWKDLEFILQKIFSDCLVCIVWHVSICLSAWNIWQKLLYNMWPELECWFSHKLYTQDSQTHTMLQVIWVYIYTYHKKYNNNNREFIERLQRFKVLYGLKKKQNTYNI